MVIKQGEEAKKVGIITAGNIRTFKIYAMPIDLINRLISYAKLHYDNKVWKVIEKGMNLIMEEEKEWKIQTDKRLHLLEGAVFGEKKEEEVKTLGGVKFGKE